MRFAFRAGLAALTFAAVAPSAHATTELVTNGDFETTTLTASGEVDQYVGNPTAVNGWTSAGYNFLFFAGTATTTGAYSPQYSNTLKLWGPGNGENNGFIDSPTGGNFFGADGAYETGPISQTINNLVVGQQYFLHFNWGAAQQYGYNGLTTEQWQVSLGNQTLSTAVITNPSHGFTGWLDQTFIYTATSTSEVLSFLAIGTPNGVPPFALLDGVSLQVPEPGALAILAVGIVAIAGARRLREQK